MTATTKQKQAFDAHTPSQQNFTTMSIGTVVDTNDPQQMGRVKIIAPMLGDSVDSPIHNLPWCLYVSPYGGQMSSGTRGPGIQESAGGMAYGWWAIPKVGAQVIVTCLDNNPQYRIYLGCVYDQHTPHTMPHGRFMYDDHPQLKKDGSDSKPQGPYTSREQFIEPLHENLRQAFTSKTEPNFEWRTRAADYQAARVDVSTLNYTKSGVQDDADAVHDGWTSNQGYQTSRSNPKQPVAETKRNFDSMVTSWTSPGFHAISMDDRQENCRMRFRTTSGHQIILDDTNERIYIATAKGRNWIELDQAGNIDMFTTNRVSIRAAKDINLTSDETVRLHGKKGVHLYSGDDICMQAVKDINMTTDQNVQVAATQDVVISATNTHLKSSGSLYLDGSSTIHVNSGGALNLTGGSSVDVKASSALALSGSSIAFGGTGSIPSLIGNLGSPVVVAGSPASAASTGTAASPAPAKWTNRVPAHEPYARGVTANDFTHAPEFAYTDDKVNKEERGVPLTRGTFWRR